MNVVLIISDTFRRDHIGAYGNDWIHTPNLDRLASQSFVFDRAYAASFPTVPNRLDVMTGRFTFTHFDWSPLPADQVVVSEMLGEAGHTTMFVVDTPHIMQRGYGFDRGFSGWKWIRGQENDRLMTSPADPPLPCAPEKLRSPDVTVKQYLRNVSERVREEDYFAPQTMIEAARWLEHGVRQQPFFLYVDTFDPHEPWDPPQWYVDLYDPGYVGEEVIYPVYGEADYLTKRELKHMQALYAGECSMVDTWVGFLLRRIDELGLRDDTAVIFTTDHGFYLGDHNLTGKSIIWKAGHANCQLYEQVARIPLMIRLPGQARSKRVRAYAQPPDLVPTILDLCGVADPGTTNGASLLPIMRGEKRANRNLAITTPSLAHDPNVGRPTTITMGEWCLVYSGNPEGPLVRHVTAAVDSVDRPARVPGDRPYPPELYHLPSDPQQEKNVFARNKAVARRIHAAHVAFLESIGMDERFLQHRRKL